LQLQSDECLRRFAEGKALKNLALQKRQLLKEQFHIISQEDLLNYLNGERMSFIGV
jgi:hypothetical protein